MNKMYKCVLLVLSSMFAMACYAYDWSKAEGIKLELGVLPPCADIQDPAKRQECEKTRHRQVSLN